MTPIPDKLRKEGLWREMLARSFHPRQWFDGERGQEIPRDPEDSLMWIYKQGQVDERWLVGYWSPDREWHLDSCFTTKEAAAARVHWLNGGGSERVLESQSA